MTSSPGIFEVIIQESKQKCQFRSYRRIAQELLTQDWKLHIIDLYPEKRKDGCWIRSIVFNFPMPVEGGEVKELSLESETTVETVCLLTREANPLTAETGKI